MNCNRLLLCLITAALLFGYGVYGQRRSSETSKRYEYQTNLKGGYRLAYFDDGKLQHLTLKRGNRTIRELSSLSTGLLQKNLGYVGSDFRYYFVLVRSFGSGNPHYIELIKKSSGRSILKNGSAWIDADQKKELLLYSEHDIPTSADKIVLMNIRTLQKEHFPFPEDVFGEREVLNRIRIKKITSSTLVILYRVNGAEKEVTYRRRIS